MWTLYQKGDISESDVLCRMNKNSGSVEFRSRDEVVEFRRRNEVVELYQQLDVSLRSAEISYTRLTAACHTAVDRLKEDIEPTTERSNRSANVIRVVSSGSFLLGGIMSGIGILATPLTAGSSLVLTAAGATLLGVGGVTTVGAGTYSYCVTKLNYDQAIELLNKFRLFMKQLCEKLLRLHKIFEIISGLRHQQSYEAIFNLMLPEENNASFKAALLLFQNFPYAKLSEIMQSCNGAVNFGKGVYEFVNFVEKLAKQGTRITKSMVIKVLIPLGIILDTAFLIASIQELRKNNKCKAVVIMELIRDIIQEEMDAIDGFCPGLKKKYIDPLLRNL